MSHTCTLYCEGDVHAFVCMGDPDIEGVDFQQYAETIGATYVGHQVAREADRDQVMQRIVYTFHGGTRQVRPATREELLGQEVYVLRLRWWPREEAQTPAPRVPSGWQRLRAQVRRVWGARR